MKVFGTKISSRNWFITKAIVLILCWQFVYHMVLAPYTSIDEWLTKNVGNGTAWVFRQFGEDSSFREGYLYVNGVRSVGIADPCNGLELYALFIGFILITPGRLITKVVFGLFGFTLLYTANIGRVYLLGVNFLKNPASFEFNHKYTYLWSVYFIVFVLWMVWIEVINKKSFAKSSE